MRRWDGVSSSSRANELAIRKLVGDPAPAAPAAQDPAPLEAGDVVRVYLDVNSRSRPEGLAVLVKRHLTLVSVRPPLEAWDVRLEIVIGDAGTELRVPTAIQSCWRVVHPADRLARGADVAASSPPDAEPLSLFEDPTERARR